MGCKPGATHVTKPRGLAPQTRRSDSLFEQFCLQYRLQDVWRTGHGGSQTMCSGPMLGSTLSWGNEFEVLQVLFLKVVQRSSALY